MFLVCLLFSREEHSPVIRRACARCYIMKTKPLFFALGICLMLLSGCAATVGTGYDTGYGYYPPAQPYYAPVHPYYARPYYARPRPAVIVPARPYYRQPSRSNYNGGRYDGYRGGNNGGYRGGNNGGGYHGGHGRSH